MSELSPSVAADLAKRVYDVQNPDLVDLFLKLPYFKRQNVKAQNPHRVLEAEVGGRILLNTKDGFGICAQGGTNNKNEIFLVFRGTTDANKKADYLTDGRIGLIRNDDGLPVHAGFEHCFSSMLPDIRQYFQSLKTGVSRVHCIGHSLGGAIASMAADWVSRHLRHPVRLYTFGAPRVGNETFAQQTTDLVGSANLHRVYHRTDPVTMVPLYPFMHAPYRDDGHYIYSAEPLTSGIAHRMASYAKSVKGKAWQQLKDTPEQPYSLEAAIEAWLESKTPVDSSSAAFWRWVDSALIYVLKKVAMAVIGGLHAFFVGTFTVIDKVAYLLAKGVDLTKNISIWVEHLMRKLMQALGMKPVRDKGELTYRLVRHVFVRLTAKANRDAKNALRKIE